MITPELADTRADFEAEFLTQTAEVWRQVPGESDAYGGQSLRYEVIAQTKCSLPRATRPQRTEEGKQGTTSADWEILVPVGLQVAFPDQLRINRRINRRIYEVRGSDDAADEKFLQILFVTRKD